MCQTAYSKFNGGQPNTCALLSKSKFIDTSHLTVAPQSTYAYLCRLSF